MEEVALIFIPSIVKLIKEAIEISNGNDEVAIGYLMGILGATEENKTRAQIAFERLRIEKELE